MFVRGNLAIDSTGVAIRDQPMCFTIAYDELELGEIIGKGYILAHPHSKGARTLTPMYTCAHRSTSMVIKARHTPTGQVLALKVCEHE